MPHPRTGITIDAPIETVWQVLTDFDAYPEWTDDVRFAATPRAGEPVSMTIRLFGRGLKATVFMLDISPPRKLCWRGGPPWLMAGTHYFELEGMGRRTRVIHGEHFQGAAVPLLWKLVGSELQGFYGRINAALAARCVNLAADGSAEPGGAG